MEQKENSQKRFDRRTFIGTSVAATLAVTAKSTSAQTENAPTGKDSKGRPLPYNPRTYQAMPTRNLGQTGHRVGIFSLGGQAVTEIGEGPRLILRNLVEV
jgi:hypothetical protein